MSRIRIATRESQLALWQANEVARLLTENHPDIEIEIIGMTTQGDRFFNRPPWQQQVERGYLLKSLSSAC